VTFLKISQNLTQFKTISLIDSKCKSTCRQSFNCLENEQKRVHEKFIPLTLHDSSKKFEAIAKFIDVYSKGHTAPAKLPLIELPHDIFNKNTERKWSFQFQHNRLAFSFLSINSFTIR